MGGDSMQVVGPTAEDTTLRLLRFQKELWQVHHEMTYSFYGAIIVREVQGASRLGLLLVILWIVNVWRR